MRVVRVTLVSVLEVTYVGECAGSDIVSVFVVTLVCVGSDIGVCWK